MKVLLISQYCDEFKNNNLPNNILLVRHFRLYHKKIYDTLKLLGHDIIIANGIEQNIEELIRKVDIVFPIKHDYGYLGGDYNILCICQKLKKTFVGCAPSSKLYDTDKIAGKLLAEKLKIKTPNYFHPYMVNDKKMKDSLYILKPRFSASSKELSDKCIYTKEKILNVISKKVNKESYFIEEFIDGVTASIGCVLSQNNNIFFSTPFTLKSKTNKVITFEDKKNGGCISATISNKKLQKKLREYSKKLFLNIQPCTMARFDFILSKSNKLYFLEINTTPTLNPENSFVHSLIQNYFKTYDCFLNHLLNVSISLIR